MRKLYLLLAFFTWFASLADAQVFLKQNEHNQRLTNGLNLFYTQLAGTNTYEMMLTYRFGSVIETANTDGLGYVCHTVFLNSLQQQLKAINNGIVVKGQYGYEFCTYQFKVPISQFENALDAIAKHYAQAPDTVAIANAIAQNAALFSILQNTLLYPAEQELIDRQWNLRAPSMSLYGPIPAADSSTMAKVGKLYTEGYCIEFALLAFNGPEPFRKVWSTVQNKLSYISSCPGELFNTKLANLFPAPNLSSQVVYGVGNATPTRYQKLYQGPYLSFDEQGCIAGMVLKQLIANSPSLKAICDSLNINKLLLAYDPMYFSSSFTWHIFPNPDSMHLSYANIDTLVNAIATKQLFSVGEIMDAKAAVLKHFESILNDPSQKLYLVSQYWANNSIPWLFKFSEALEAINHEHISKMVSTYIVGQKYTTLLLLNEADTSTYDFNLFATTYTDIDSVTFNFQRNTAQFASSKDDSTLSAFKQTLLINKDLMVSINGQAYKSELLKVKDDSLTAELNQYDGFYLYPGNILKENTTYRLDIYRSAILIAKLLKAGVGPIQLKGTGRLLKADEGKEAYQITVSPVFNKKKL